MPEREVAASAANEEPAIRPPLPFGTLAFVGALGSLITCYGTIFAEAFVGPQAWVFNPHLQAVVMWGFGLLALFGLWRDRRRHGSPWPLLAGATGLSILLFSLYVVYDIRIEILAYVFLVFGALLNQTAMIGRLYRTVRGQSRQIEELNRDLEQRVDRQVREIGRLERLKGFLAPSVAELVLADDRSHLLDSHRRYVACLFCDIRRFTALAEALEPEETIGLLQAYHEQLGELVSKHRGTIGYRAGDGLMAFFNDPVPCDQPVLDAVKLALDIRAALDELCAHWQKLGHSIGIGVGIASGYATLGLVGQEGRADYTAIGNVVNLASRVCEKAADRTILIESRAYADVEGQVDVEAHGALTLKGVGKDVETYRVLGLRETSGR